MLEGRGTQFDPRLLDLFLGAFDEVLEIRRTTAESVRMPARQLSWPLAL